MSWIDAIKSGDVLSVEKMLEDGASVIGEVDGQTPLQLVSTLIKEAIEKQEFKLEEDFKNIASMLIVYGANVEELGHDGGEVNDIASSINRYILIYSSKNGDSSKVEELIKNEKIWFKDDNSEYKEALLTAINKRDLKSIEDLLRDEKINFAYEQ